MMNVMNTRPGFLDRATLGNPGKYSFCFAEHPDDLPWEPFSIARGFAPGDSTVTVYASNSLYQVYNQLAAAPEPLLACLAGALGNVGAPNVKGFNQTLVVLAGEHAEILRARGWRRADVQRFLLEHTRHRVADLKRAARLPGAQALAEPRDRRGGREGAAQPGRSRHLRHRRLRVLLVEQCARRHPDGRAGRAGHRDRHRALPEHR